MFGILRKTVITTVAAGAAVVAVNASANAAIIGHGDYIYEVGTLTDTGSQPSLALQLNGGTIFTVANAYTSVGTTFSLATVAPSAFAALVAVLRDNNEDDITISAFALPPGAPGIVTVTDFNYSPPANDDLQGVGNIIDVLLRINQFETVHVPIVGLASDLVVNRYDIDIDVEAIPVPATVLSAASAFALMGFLAVRRKRSA